MSLEGCASTELNMDRTTNRRISNLQSHAVSVHIPSHVLRYKLKIPCIRLKPLNLHSARSFHFPSVSSSDIFHNGPKIVLSPLKRSVARKYSVHNKLRFPKQRQYHKISKCNSNRCVCCKYLVCKPHIKSTVNGRTFNVKLNTDID